MTDPKELYNEVKDLYNEVKDLGKSRSKLDDEAYEQLRLKELVASLTLEQAQDIETVLPLLREHSISETIQNINAVYDAIEHILEVAK